MASIAGGYGSSSGSFSNVRCVSHVGVGVGVDSASIQTPLYNTTAEDWVEHIAAALTSLDSLLGKQTATYVLPPLIRQGGIENIEKAQKRKQKVAANFGGTLEYFRLNTGLKKL